MRNYAGRRAARWAHWKTLDVITQVRALEGSHLLNILNYIAQRIAGLPHDVPSQYSMMATTPRLLLTGEEPRFRTIREIVREASWRGYLFVGRTFRLGPLERRPNVWDAKTIAWVYAWSQQRFTLPDIARAAAGWAAPSLWDPKRNIGALPEHNRLFRRDLSLPFSQVVPVIDPDAAATVHPPPSAVRHCRHCGNKLTTPKTYEAGCCTRLACRAAEAGLTTAPTLPILQAPETRTGKRRIVMGD